ncbi:MAG TPA: hypothetical protein VN667_06735 [Burkholderiales bacterium]|nr:hypothetical protein [Burkholderiales bacterium]
MDFVYLALIIGFVFLSALLVYGFERLRGQGSSPKADLARKGMTR